MGGAGTPCAVARFLSGTPGPDRGGRRIAGLADRGLQALEAARMRLLSRDLGGRLYGAVSLVSLALLALFGLFDLIDQLDSGRGVSVTEAMGLTGLLLPAYFYELLPVATLIGSLLVMAQIASSSEYTIVRASGVSVVGMARILAVPTLAIALVGVLAGEWLAPLADRYARQLRLGGDDVVAQQMRSGYWLKDGPNFVNLAGVLPDGEMSLPVIYQFAADGRLSAIRRAASARFDGARYWRLQKVEATLFSADGVTVQRVAEERWETRLGPGILKVMAVAPDRMSATELWPYLQHLRANRQQTGRYETALWSKALYPLSIVAMLLLSLSFARMQGRAGGTLFKVFAGILLGVAFYFLSRVGNNLGQLNAWPPLVGAGAATAVFIAAAVVLLRRVERV
ncbi:MAG: LPS export ABC transporter permease LptG [Rhodocyclaceae bacterium]|nr:LPS export ABC transporter permease LptG [Rhodocyclaceae bacterium]